jgi:hypothetical protein
MVIDVATSTFLGTNAAIYQRIVSSVSAQRCNEDLESILQEFILGDVESFQITMITNAALAE